MSPRSPIIFWLLLAATFSVDAVVISWMAGQAYPGSPFVIVTFHALLLSQLSLVCIWAALNEQMPWPWRWGGPFAAVLAAVLATALLIDKPLTLRESFVNHFAYFGVHAAMLIAVLWLLRHTRTWERRSGAGRHLQFSIAQLLMVTTVVAVLAATVRSSPFFGDERWVNILFLFSSVALAIASVLFWSSPRHALLRLAGVLGFALLLGLVFLLGARVASTDMVQPIVLIVIGTHYLIQAIMLSLWLGLGPVVPLNPSSEIGEC